MYTSLEKVSGNAYKIGGINCEYYYKEYYISLKASGETTTLYLIQPADEDGSVDMWNCGSTQKLTASYIPD